MRLRTALAGLFLTVLSAAAEPVPDDFYTHAARLVVVDGQRRLNLACMGQGSPTVLFDGGQGDSMLVWRLVQGEVAKLTHACAYDRAGIGFSDPRSGVSDVRAIAADLHSLLVAAKIAPIVYVGHSGAGLYGVMLAATHPEDLAGGVLVEPAFANQWNVISAAGTAAGAPQAASDALLVAMRAQIPRMRECAALPAPLPDDCARLDKRLPSDLGALKKAQNSRPSYLLTKASEVESFQNAPNDISLDQKELESVTASFGDKPLIVLTRGKEVGNPGFTAEQSAAMNRAWTAGNARLAALSTRGRQIIVPDSSHYIQYDQPQAVIEAVTQVVMDVRDRRQAHH